MSEVQKIGLDIGRGYVKAYSEFNGIEKEAMFKAIIGDGRELDFKDFENPMYIRFEKEDNFIGLLAEKESQIVIRNSKDSKVSEVARILFAAALSEIAVADEVDIVIGVPYKSFKKSVLKEVIETYKDNIIEVKDKIKGGIKKVKINNIAILREADAALYWQVKDKKKNDKPVGMVAIGFRTTEISYFEKGLKFNDKKSTTIEFGNRSIMQNVKDELEHKNIFKEINEIDTSDEYNTLKNKAYKRATERIEQTLEDMWVNLDEMDIYIAGGTSKNMEFDSQFIKVDDPQMITAKGLYLVATRTFK